MHSAFEKSDIIDVQVHVYSFRKGVYQSIKLTTGFLLVASVFAVVLAVAQLLATDALFLSRAQELGVGA